MKTTPPVNFMLAAAGAPAYSGHREGVGVASTATATRSVVTMFPAREKYSPLIIINEKILTV